VGDGMGIPTVNAASIHGYARPLALYIQNMPHIGLSETSAADTWITDSAAGMTAIMTGEKTRNGVVSQSSEATRGVRNGLSLKTTLEYAEERGLSTGVVSNSDMDSATVAACYAHSNDRKDGGEIFVQLLTPRYGDGVDVVIGPGRKSILQSTAALGLNLVQELPHRGYAFFDRIEKLDAGDPQKGRAIVLLDSGDFDLAAAVDHAVDVLARNPKGFFLMVESDNHSADVSQTLERTVAFDKVIRRIAERTRHDTLILCTADHSFGLRLMGGKAAGDAPKGQEIVSRVDLVAHHTGEEVLVAAEGPGAEQVRGIFPNTRLFRIMLSAYGWDIDRKDE
jgi:alkaline phosphatase